MQTSGGTLKKYSIGTPSNTSSHVHVTACGVEFVPELIQSADHQRDVARVVGVKPLGDHMEAGVTNHVWSLDEIIALLGDK